MNSNIIFRKVKKEEVEKIGELYVKVVDHLNATENFSGWSNKFYPTLAVAKTAYNENSLFVLVEGSNIIGTAVLNHNQAKEYKEVDWGYKENKPEEVLVVHTLCINPDYLNQGYAGKIMDYIKDFAVSIGAKTIRLDVSYNNKPAQKLYEKKEYLVKGKISLDVNRPGFLWWHALEILL